jgi:hypothetical protein
MVVHHMTQAAADLRATLDQVAAVLGLDRFATCIKETEELLAEIEARDPETHRLVGDLMRARFNWARYVDEIEDQSMQGYLGPEGRHQLDVYLNAKHQAAGALEARLRHLAEA